MHMSIYENSNKKYKFLEKYNLSKLVQEEIVNTNSSVIIRKIEFVNKNFS